MRAAVDVDAFYQAAVRPGASTAASGELLVLSCDATGVNMIPAGPVYPLVAAGLALMVAFPTISKSVPAPLVSIVVLTVITVAAGVAVPTVGDKGKLPSALPIPACPTSPSPSTP